MSDKDLIVITPMDDDVTFHAADSKSIATSSGRCAGNAGDAAAVGGVPVASPGGSDTDNGTAGTSAPGTSIALAKPHLRVCKRSTRRYALERP